MKPGKLYRTKYKIGFVGADVPANSIILFLKNEKKYYGTYEDFKLDVLYKGKILTRTANMTFERWFEEVSL